MERTPRDVAQSMLNRYSSAKLALQMAQFHAIDCLRPEFEKSLQWWRSVAREIQVIANIGPDGNPQ